MRENEQRKAVRGLAIALPGAPMRREYDASPDLRDPIDRGLLAGLDGTALAMMAARRQWASAWLAALDLGAEHGVQWRQALHARRAGAS